MIKLKKNLILHDDFWSENGSLIFDYDKKILRTSFSSCICRNCFSGTECFRKEFASSKLQSTIIHENFIEIFCLFKYHIIKLIDIRTKQEYFPKVNNVLIFNDQFYEVKNLCSINVNSYIFPNFKISRWNYFMREFYVYDDFCIGIGSRNTKITFNPRKLLLLIFFVLKKFSLSERCIFPKLVIVKIAGFYLEAEFEFMMESARLKLEIY